ncbi:dsDNA nuclease domain-containing protein [Labilibaculum antarcticum]|uniref:NB-ARC domain-containing protein n=1 Tax=Labilibaculum antarcticum TaxID=1717717 RepID=A0A1Y1CTT1_9BACT|nr:NB-ARC domain-containing protein [Labilibaculum antarcticum]BAX82681.1 hypothetical protein ALGA_4391 [Labilibaculum antarcticum]
MIDKDYIKIFDINTDAVAVNRGFYYQYLITLKKWIQNYIDKKNTFVYCEVDDDIKEVGNSLIFTQVKCYSRNFSLKSDEIKKTLFNFFIQFLKNKQDIPIGFCFTTNTGLVKSEKLIKAWMANPELTDSELANQILKKVKEILNSEINKNKRKKTEKKTIVRKEIDLIKVAAEQLKKQVAYLSIDSFVKYIKWEFLDYDPILAIDLLFEEVRQLLSHEIFKNKPVSIIENILLSEIFRCSQLQDSNKRVLSNSRIDEILNNTDSDINRFVDDRLISLLGVKFEEIEQNFKNIQRVQNSFEKRLDSFDDRIILNDTSYPKSLTLIPKSLSQDFNDSQESIDYVIKKLLETNHLCINGNGGVGKTFFAKSFVSQINEQYDHIAWINSSPNLTKSILLNAALKQNLKLDFNNQTNDEERIDIVCSELQRIDGKNLLIIDNYENDFRALKKIISLDNWKILITTRERVPNLLNYTLPGIDKEIASKIFCNYSNEEIDSDNSILLEFFEYVNYNPLIIKLCGKTIANSIDLNLESLYSSIKEQKLDNESLEIEIDLSEEDLPHTILAYLYKTFELKNLTKNEEIYLEFLALLPSEEVSIKDIALIGGKESYNKNLKDFTNWTNSLHKKGWIERVNGEVRMYRLVQELIIYKTRKQQNGFISNVLLFNWLFHRIDEVAQSDPTLSFPFLKYAESILKAIKEEYRQSIYQPLLLLENALLNSYTWIENTSALHQRWIDLVKRAELYLPNDDVNLGIMYNNLGYSYARRNDIETAVDYFKKSIFTLTKQEEESINVLINSLNNLTQAYLVLENLPSADKIQKKTRQLLKKYSLTTKQFEAVSYFLRAVFLMKSENFRGAIEQYELAIQTHLKIEKDSRNDFLLLMYYSNLILMLFKAKQSDKVIENIDNIREIIETHKMSYSSVVNEVKIMIDNINDFYQKGVKQQVPTKAYKS